MPGPAGPLAVRVYTPARCAGPRHARAMRCRGWCIFTAAAWWPARWTPTTPIARALATCRSAAVWCRWSIGWRRSTVSRPRSRMRLAAVGHIAAHAPEFGIDAARLGICGDSAGGTLAAAVCQALARAGGPRLALQLLLCPILDYSRSTGSRREFARGYLVDRPRSITTWSTTSRRDGSGRSARLAAARRRALGIAADRHSTAPSSIRCAMRARNISCA